MAEGEWIIAGEKEYAKGSDGRWRMRDKGASTAPGIWVSKEYAENEIKKQKALDELKSKSDNPPPAEPSESPPTTPPSKTKPNILKGVYSLFKRTDKKLPEIKSAPKKLFILFLITLLFYLYDNFVLGPGFSTISIFANILYLILFFMFMFEEERTAGELFGIMLLFLGIFVAFTNIIYGLVFIFVAIFIAWKQNFPQGIKVVFSLALLRLLLPVIISNFKFLHFLRELPVISLLLMKIFPYYLIYILFVAAERAEIDKDNKVFHGILNILRIVAVIFLIFIVVGQSAKLNVGIPLELKADETIEQREAAQKTITSAWDNFLNSWRYMWASFQCMTTGNCEKKNQMDAEKIKDEETQAIQADSSRVSNIFLDKPMSVFYLREDISAIPLAFIMKAYSDDFVMVSFEGELMDAAGVKQEVEPISAFEKPKGVPEKETGIPVSFTSPLKKGTFYLTIKGTFTAKQYTVYPFYVFHELSGKKIEGTGEMRSLVSGIFGAQGISSITYPKTNLATVSMGVSGASTEIKRIKEQDVIILNIALKNEGAGLIKEIKELKILLPEGWKIGISKQCPMFNQQGSYLISNDQINKIDFKKIPIGRQNIIASCTILIDKIDFPPNKPEKKTLYATMSYDYVLEERVQLVVS